jgi:hypothetical protein
MVVPLRDMFLSKRGGPAPSMMGRTLQNNTGSLGRPSPLHKTQDEWYHREDRRQMDQSRDV